MHVKRCSASSAIREIQIKTTMRYQPSPSRMAVIKGRYYNKCNEHVNKLELIHWKVVLPLWKTCWLLQRLNVLTIWPSMVTPGQLPGIYPKRRCLCKILYTQVSRSNTPHKIANNTNNQIPVNWWTHQWNVIHACNGILFGNEIKYWHRLQINVWLLKTLC